MNYLQLAGTCCLLGLARAHVQSLGSGTSCINYFEATLTVPYTKQTRPQTLERSKTFKTGPSYQRCMIGNGDHYSKHQVMQTKRVLHTALSKSDTRVWGATPSVRGKIRTRKYDKRRDHVSRERSKHCWPSTNVKLTVDYVGSRCQLARNRMRVGG